MSNVMNAHFQNFLHDGEHQRNRQQFLEIHSEFGCRIRQMAFDFILPPAVFCLLIFLDRFANFGLNANQFAARRRFVKSERRADVF